MSSIINLIFNQIVSGINFKLHRFKNHWVKVYILYSVNNSETCIFNAFFGFLFKEKTWMCLAYVSAM